MTKNSNYRETRINLASATVTRWSDTQNTRPNFFILVNNGAGTIYVGLTPNVGSTSFELVIPAYGTRIYGRPDAPTDLYFYATADCALFIGSDERDFDPSMIAQTQEIAAVSGSGLLGIIDIRYLLNSIPAGTNLIGAVDINSLPSLPAGANSIGNVGVTSLPSLPAGAAEIGKVGLTAGTALIGKVGVDDVTTIKDLFAYVSANDTSTGAVLSVSLTKGFRIKTAVMVTTDTASTFKIYGSLNGTDYFEVDSIVMSGAGDGYKMVELPMSYVKVENSTSGDHEVTIVAGGF